MGKHYLFEFYSKDYAENIISLLHNRYDGVTFFSYPGNTPAERTFAALRKICRTRFGIDAELVEIAALSVEEVAGLFLSRMKPDCTYEFDITGGSGLFISAVGYLLRDHSEQISLHFYDLYQDKRLIGDGSSAYITDVDDVVTFSDLVELKGGKILRSAGGKNYDFTNPRLKEEILTLWNASRYISREWNRFCTLPREKLFYNGETHFRRKLLRREDREACQCVSERFRAAGIIGRYEFLTEGGYTYVDCTPGTGYRTEALYEKAGTALEFYACLAATECGFLTDCSTGVEIDMDGVISGGPRDTRNELDMVAIYRNRPVFCSCKNTLPTKEHLYEVQSMAQQLGGKYAYAILISTTRAQIPVQERALEMKIGLIDDLAGKSLDSFKSELKRLFGKLSD